MNHLKNGTEKSHNPIAFSSNAKGSFAMLERAYTLLSRYGFTPGKMDRALQLFTRILRQFDCGASFAVPAIVLERNNGVIDRYLDENIEFVAHGYTHIDYSQLESEERIIHLRRAHKVFAAAGIKVTGFRSPYLRREVQLNHTLEAADFSYASNQPILWDVLNDNVFTSSTYLRYERAIAFYEPWRGDERPSLPRLSGDRFVEIPVSLPDDEMLIDRLRGEKIKGLVEGAWQAILAETHRRGELFTLQLHPERTAYCADGLTAVLSKARQLAPAVWCARLDEMANWWRARTAALVEVKALANGSWRLSVDGPPGVTILARGVDTLEPSEPWDGRYRRIAGTTCHIQAERRPFIGVSPASSTAMVSFLRQQGYIVKINPESHAYSIYLDRIDFAPEDELPLLNYIEENAGPLVRLSRWPDGARSALCVSGDIDAFTLWDYGTRFFGK